MEGERRGEIGGGGGGFRYKPNPPLSAIDRFLWGQKNNQTTPKEFCSLPSTNYTTPTYNNGSSFLGFSSWPTSRTTTSSRNHDIMNLVGEPDYLFFDDENCSSWLLNDTTNLMNPLSTTQEDRSDQTAMMIKKGGKKIKVGYNNSSLLIKGQWTEEEDRKLIKLVMQFGERKWAQIADKFDGRAGKQCRERWHNHLRPDIKKDGWSEKEERMLIEAHQIVGNRWAEIAKRIPGRTENSIKNHFNATKRRQNSRRKNINEGVKSQTSILQDYIKSSSSSSTHVVAPSANIAATISNAGQIDDQYESITPPLIPHTSYDDELDFIQNFFNNNPSCHVENVNSLVSLKDGVNSTGHPYSDTYLLKGGSNINNSTHNNYSSSTNSNDYYYLDLVQDHQQKEMDLIEMVSYNSHLSNEAVDMVDSGKKMILWMCSRDKDVDSAQYEAVNEVEALLPWWEQFPRRWIIVLMCFSAFLLCSMDRVNMSMAILPMSAEYNWNPTTVGLVQSSFFWGYLLTQIAGGVWADKVGGKAVLGFAVIWWSIATILTPVAAKLGLPCLLVARAVMGIGEGVAMPAMNNILSKWVPVGERTRSLALVYTGMSLGSVIGLAFSPFLIHSYGWPSVFYSFGSLGIVWFAIWLKKAYSSPFDDPHLLPAEKNLIVGSRLSQEPVKAIPWKLILSKPPVWALITCHFCHNWGAFILTTWMPTYYNQVLKFNLSESGLFCVLPLIMVAFSANLSGWIADTLVTKGYSVTRVRKMMQTIGFLGPAFFLTQLRHMNSPAMAVLCIACSQASDAFSQSGLYSNHQDIAPRYSGVLLGLSNTAGVMAGMLGTATTGYIVQHGSWDDVFKVSVGLYLVGTVIWNLFSTGKKIID